MSAHAWQLERFGEPLDVLQFVERARQPLGSGELRIEVAANGLNFLDTSICRGTHPLRPPLPFVPGAEVVGVVTEAGAGAERIRPGSRVVAINPRAYGCFGAEAVVPEDAAHLVPAELPDPEAASLLVTYQTAYFSLVRRAQVQAGEWVLVHAAAGALGSALVQIALAGGARVIATAGTEEKREACMHLGAAVALDHRDPGLAAAIREATGGHGVDVACDSIGGEAFGAAVEAAAFEARILPLGWSGGTPPALDASVFVARNLTLVGVSWGGGYPTARPALVRDAHARILGLIESGQVRPLIGLVKPAAELPQALQLLADGRTTGKTVVTWGDRPG